MTERDIWRSANILLKRFGRSAALVAAMRADELLAKGDIAGTRAWQRILFAVEQFQSEDAIETKH